MSELALQHERWTGARERLGFQASSAVVRAELLRPTRQRRKETPPVAVPPPVGVPFNFYAFAHPAVIIRYVALKHGLKYYDIVGTMRYANVVAARREAVRLVKSHCPTMTSSAIGRLFHRDHASILNLLRGKRQRHVEPMREAA